VIPRHVALHEVSLKTMCRKLIVAIRSGEKTPLVFEPLGYDDKNAGDGCAFKQHDSVDARRAGDDRIH